ncbi:MAG TPA: hypothetical protein VIE44_15595 [Methylomirabilota bacterium]|jgi:hypothetical protein
MSLSGAVRILAPFALLPLVLGCADVGYRERSTLTHTRYATIENFSDEPIAEESVDELLEEVADILHVTLVPSTPKVRIMVVPASRISELFGQFVMVAPHGSDARALYLPGANLVAIPYYSRNILGHELAHYLTDHYLKSTPRRRWERIALMVEDALPDTPRVVARRSPAPEDLAARTALAPLWTPAN